MQKYLLSQKIVNKLMEAKGGKKETRCWENIALWEA